METKDGFLVINKDKGCTSHDCVKRIRKLLNTKKVGHTGTLDPEAIGTLPIAIGSATRFIQYLPQGKTYIGQIKLGIRTNTDDIHGEIINQKSWPKISDEKLDQYLNTFRGIIKQIPPEISLLHSATLVFSLNSITFLPGPFPIETSSATVLRASTEKLVPR